MISKNSSSLKFEFQVSILLLFALFILSCASLSYEINITRIFSVTQFYHFAYLIVSLALLGYGASGAFLVIFPKFGERNISDAFILISFFTGLCFLGAYIVTNNVPFDSFSVILGWKYIGLLLLHMIVLATPFFFSGLSVILLINSFPNQTNLIYGVNLIGSAFGCLLAMVIPNFLGAVGLVTTCTILAASVCVILAIYQVFIARSLSVYTLGLSIFALSLVIFGLFETAQRLNYRGNLSIMELNISPYKGISYALQYPGAEIIFQKWNAYSRVDLIRSNGIRSLPGYSILSSELPPEQDGLFIDADELSPVIRQDITENITDYLPSSIAYDLRPDAKVLVLEPQGGLELVIACSKGAREIQSSEPNPLIIEAANTIYSRCGFINHLETGRSFLSRSQELFGVIIISLNSSFHPVRSGAYGLGEDYRYTVDAFEDAMNRLDFNGFLVMTRWLQTPPSEFLKVFGLAIEAIDNIGGSPENQIAAFRSYNTGTLLIKNGVLTSEDVNTIKKFAENRAYDIVYFPGIQKSDVNKYNVLPSPDYYQLFTSLLSSDAREEWYTAYPYQVKPPTDNQPFFSQYFKWSQLPQIIAEYGKVWQPFGGAGFLILLILLVLTILLSLCLILFPSFIFLKTKMISIKDIGILIYFAAIGLAFLFIEIPMIQSFILFLDNPAYSITIVLFSILLFSGIGSRVSGFISIKNAFVGLLIILLLNITLLRHIIDYCLGLPLGFRIAVAILLLAPTGFFMGIPFPIAIRTIQFDRKYLIPWAWSINGSFSVVAGIAAALLAISLGFRFVFVVGFMFYFLAWLLIKVEDIQFQSLHQ